ncbi:hypothetical protein DAMA08_048800 [Martiniozyma asiatica (nom. inval.)]|nr:hypothetical protein DAMA08_048800 [Martiniozyma asiatica]
MLFTENYQRHKRHIPPSEQPPTKKRIVSDLSSLHLGSNFSKGHGPVKTVFGTFNKQDLNSTPSYEHPNKVVINNIDQFLRENPDQLDSLDTRELTIDQKALNEAWSRVMDRISSDQNRYSNFNNDKNYSSEEYVSKLVWEEYLNKMFGVIPYYNPLKVIWDNYCKWQEERWRGKNQITELNQDFGTGTGTGMGMDMDMDNGMDMNFDSDMRDDAFARHEYNNGYWGEDSLNNGMSNYGGYYDQEWNPMAYNDGDIEMMD